MTKKQSKDTLGFQALPSSDDETIAHALAILDRRLRVDGVRLANNDEAKNYCALMFGALPYEVFTCLFLDSDYRVISTKEISRGTVDHTPAVPREVLREAITANAWGVVMCHNHPGQDSAEPSDNDLRITKRMKQALTMIDVALLDHIVVAKAKATSIQQYLSAERAKQAKAEDADDDGDLIVHEVGDEMPLPLKIGLAKALIKKLEASGLSNPRDAKFVNMAKERLASLRDALNTEASDVEPTDPTKLN